MLLHGFAIGCFFLALGLVLYVRKNRIKIKAYHARQDELFQIAESRTPAPSTDQVCEFYYGKGGRPQVMESRPEIDTDLYDIPTFLRKQEQTAEEQNTGIAQHSQPPSQTAHNKPS